MAVPPALRTAPVPEIRPANGVCIGPRQPHLGVVDDIADDAAGGAGIADLQGAGTDRGTAGIEVVGREDDGAAAGLEKAPAPETTPSRLSWMPASIRKVPLPARVTARDVAEARGGVERAAVEAEPAGEIAEIGVRSRYAACRR